MEVLYPRCAGLDVHQANVVACVRIANGARASHEVRTFETTTKGLLAFGDWLREAEHARGNGVHGCLLKARVARAGGGV